MITRLDGWTRLHEGDGRDNAGWFGWRQPVLAPFDATIEAMHVIEDGPNRPGEPDEGRATSIRFVRNDGVRVTYVHVREIEVEAGEEVAAGQRVARVGNNGPSRSPHIHIGAWRDETPLQVRFDLRAFGRLLGHLD